MRCPVTIEHLEKLRHSRKGRPTLVCFICDGQYSANPADYFSLTPRHIFTCCGTPMSLAHVKTVLS